MTAELVIMNGRAVAMAADSAVTLSNGEDQNLQTYFSANKLFSLSYQHPVGIMLYQGASVHSVPWETIIKVYRKELGDTVFDHLHQYADDFISFLRREHKVLVSEALQQTDFKNACLNFLHSFYECTTDSWKKMYHECIKADEEP
ncbi:MAG: hypothetical protein KUG81_04985, partial [Gammaproteobacteria bacterium]|nr:hypothetical protein [Gammaproteobacteria bacterium]